MKKNKLLYILVILIIGQEIKSQNVGIGTLSPQFPLHVGGDVFLEDNLRFDDTDQTKIYKNGYNLNLQARAQLKLRSGGGVYDVEVYSGGIRFATFEGGSHSLGLSTNTPREKLDVIGNMIVDGAIYVNSQDHSIQETPSGNLEIKSIHDILIAPSDNVQIGDGETPKSKLELNGSFAKPLKIEDLTSYTLKADDHTVILTSANSDAYLPAASSAPGREYKLKFINAGCTIQTNGVADTIDGLSYFFVVPGLTTSGLNGVIITLQSDGVGTWFITNIDS